MTTAKNRPAKNARGGAKQTVMSGAAKKAGPAKKTAKTAIGRPTKAWDSPQTSSVRPKKADHPVASVGVMHMAACAAGKKMQAATASRPA